MRAAWRPGKRIPCVIHIPHKDKRGKDDYPLVLHCLFTPFTEAIENIAIIDMHSSLAQVKIFPRICMGQGVPNSKNWNDSKHNTFLLNDGHVLFFASRCLMSNWEQCKTTNKKLPNRINKTLPSCKKYTVMPRQFVRKPAVTQVYPRLWV